MSMAKTAREIGIHRRTLYYFLDGNLKQLSAAKRRALCRVWNVKWSALESEIRLRARARPKPICEHCYTCPHYAQHHPQGETTS